MKKVILSTVAAFLFSSMLFAFDLGVHVQPKLAIPLGGSFKIGYGAAAGVDIDWFNIRERDSLFTTLEGSYLSFTVPGIKNQSVIDGSFNIGYEFRIVDRISVSAEAGAGIYFYTGDSDLNIPSFGNFLFGGKISGNYYVSPSLKVSAFAGYNNFSASPSTFLNSIEVGIGVRYSISKGLFGRSNISMEDSSLDLLFPVFYSRYSDNSFGQLAFVNNEMNDITDVEVSVFIDSYMSNPNVVASIPYVARGESFTTEALAFLNENMLNLLQPKVSDVEVTVSYKSLGEKMTSSYMVPVTALSRNSMTWEDDRRAAAFVSGKDSSAQRFARQVQSIVKKELSKDIPQNIQYAAAMFGALKAFGINYVVDPSSAFTDNVGTAAVDFLQFPYQTLSYHGGDCDDLSILNCSLLEAIGIDTAFITVPGHIYIAFDSGLSESDVDAKKIAEGKYIPYEGKVWVPLEITLSQDTFRLAWSYGAREWIKAGEEGVIIPMKDAWSEYLPVSIPESDSSISVPNRDAILKNFKEAKYY